MSQPRPNDQACLNAMRRAFGRVALAAVLTVFAACESMDSPPASRPSGTSRPATGTGAAPAAQPTPPSAAAPTPPVPSAPSTAKPPAAGKPPTPPTSPATTSAACPQGSPPIGVLAVVSDIVFRNNRQAANGERVCNGDTITTNATGVGLLLPDGDRESDSIHFAENTDPRITRTEGGCISVDNYHSGRVVVTARRYCVVVRTRDTLMLLTNGRAQFQVTRNTATSVVPVSGALTKLQPLTEQQVGTLSRAQLTQQAAPVAQQPQPLSLNVYTQYKLVRPAVRLPPSEIRRIDGAVLRRTTPVIPR